MTNPATNPVTNPISISIAISRSIFIDHQIDEKFDQKSCQNEPNINEKSIKNRSKSRSGRLFRPLEVIFMLGPKKYRCIPRSRWASWGVLGASGAVLGGKGWPRWLQVGSKNEPKSVLRRPGAVLGASWRLHVVDFQSKVDEIEACYLGLHFWMDF